MTKRRLGTADRAFHCVGRAVLFGVVSRRALYLFGAWLGSYFITVVLLRSWPTKTAAMTTAPLMTI